MTVVLALIEGTAMTIGFGGQGLLENPTWYNMAVVVVALTAGSAFLMWIGERVTQNGVGNGISIVLLVNIVSRMPDDFVTLYAKFMQGKSVAMAALAAVIILAVILVTIVFVIILQDGERRIPVQYSKKLQGRKVMGGTEHAHPDEGQHGRSYPRNLRIFPDVRSRNYRGSPRKDRRYGNRKQDYHSLKLKQLV